LRQTAFASSLASDPQGLGLNKREEIEMAKYCVEKFESDTGEEKIVCWKQNKHVHDATLIKTIQKKLETKYAGTWSVRANSYRSNQSRCPENSVEY